MSEFAETENYYMILARNAVFVVTFDFEFGWTVLEYKPAGTFYKTL